MMAFFDVESDYASLLYVCDAKITQVGYVTRDQDNYLTPGLGNSQIISRVMIL